MNLLESSIRISYYLMSHFEAQGMTNPMSSPAATELRVTPLVDEYLSMKRKDISKLLKVYVSNYMTGSFDDSSPTRTKVSLEGYEHPPEPPQLLEYLLSEPDPNSPKDFMEKRKIRRKRGLGLIQKFWIRNSRVISPREPKVL